MTLANAPVELRRMGMLMASAEHVNGDGLDDFVVHVSTEKLALSQADDVAVLEGKTSEGLRILGTDTVTIVPRNMR